VIEQLKEDWVEHGLPIERLESAGLDLTPFNPAFRHDGEKQGEPSGHG
jgi:hypothetical protein